MTREFEFLYPEDIPRTGQHRWHLKHFLQTIQASCGTFGEDGSDVGFGFIWQSQRGLGTKTISTLARTMRRALIAERIISRNCEPYHLVQRVMKAQQ